MDRRNFICAAGAAFTSLLAPGPAEALSRTDAIYANAILDQNGQHGLAVLTEDGRIVWKAALPARGHDVAVCPVTGRLVVFARRPGTFALAIDRGANNEPHLFSTPENRHFYGHGVFTSKGKLLLATENDYENATGVIGIYDATDGFRRLGEFPSHGIGPHEIRLMADGRTIAVANGGIETHPDFGRAKLNLADMRPSLVLIDAGSGDLIERFELPESQNKLSIRHLDMTADGAVIFGCQNEGDVTDDHRLVGKFQPGVGAELFAIPKDINASLRGYVGSVCTSEDGASIAVSSPKGKTIIVLSAADGALVGRYEMNGGCGLERSGDGFLASSAFGHFGKLDAEGGKIRHPEIAFDNHMTVL